MPKTKDYPEQDGVGAHRHEWRLMRKSNISTRFKNAPPTLETIVDLVLDPGDSSELWTCPECGEDRFKYRSGFMQLMAAASPPKKGKL